MNAAYPRLRLLVRALGRQAALSDGAVAGILALAGTRRTIEPATYLVREGDPPEHCLFLLDGFAFRQKVTSEGARQIVGLHIPGDALDLQHLYLDAADHNVQALTRCEALQVPRAQVQELVDADRSVAHAVVVNLLVEASLAREWLLNVGRRDARARLAHLLCEFATRLDARGLNDGGRYMLPMTQEQLGDALGLTAVHVNRTLKTLEVDGVLQREGRRIRFSDWDRLRLIADFSPGYLHLDRQAAAD